MNTITRNELAGYVLVDEHTDEYGVTYRLWQHAKDASAFYSRMTRDQVLVSYANARAEWTALGF